MPMFNLAQHCAATGGAVLEAQLASLNAYACAVWDGGMELAERQVEAYRTALASGTVAAKQIMSGPVDPAR